MNCEGVRRNIAALYDGELGAAEAEEVRRHLGACEACARAAADFRRTLAACSTWRDEEPAGDFADRMARVASFRPRRIPAARRALLAVAAVLLLGIATALLSLRQGEQPAAAESNGSQITLEMIATAIVTNDFDRIEDDEVWGILVGKEAPVPPGIMEVILFRESGAS